MAKLPRYMTFVEKDRQKPLSEAHIEINLLHPAAWPILVRGIVTTLRRAIRHRNDHQDNK